ncbi:hypothetical protein ZHAS_00016136 [Anopheles sinensis]|uniref:Uncharacterized protein n=1 Tax=Anopheles sinensis TaxID=74873 RepID=A0A084WCS5_ANOSI|nr:hypothetical protein ZHAS_00016136 [Anopheles sinensis]
MALNAPHRVVEKQLPEGKLPHITAKAVGPSNTWTLSTEQRQPFSPTSASVWRVQVAPKREKHILPGRSVPPAFP